MFHEKPSGTVKYISTITLGIILLLAAYWLKSNVGISFLEHFSLSRYFPFSHLVPNRIIDSPEPGMLLFDNFDKVALFGNWNPLWMREEGTAIKSIDGKGYNSTKCLLITNQSQASWSCSLKKSVQVRPGEWFSFKARIRLTGQNLTAQAAVATFDESHAVIAWNYGPVAAHTSGEWVELAGQFLIPEDVSFIRFRFSGMGAGKFRFDDVEFTKLADSQPPKP